MMDYLDSTPLVSIRCTAYNHAKYIRQALDGFVMQQTTFKFEAIVHDDASTDGTADIIREYAEKYPDIIKPIFETENQYSKHDGSLGRIMDQACIGKYIAMCEGDDYWTDPLKLQKQVDFLEEHTDFSICYCQSKILLAQESRIVDDFMSVGEPQETDVNFLISNGNYIHTATVMIRKDDEISRMKQSIGRLHIGDYVQNILYAQKGKIWRIDECMSVYRYGSGTWNSSENPQYKQILTIISDLSRLCPYIKNIGTKIRLDDRIQEYNEILISIIQEKENELVRIRQSRLYQIVNSIRKLSKPFKKIMFRRK